MTPKDLSKEWDFTWMREIEFVNPDGGFAVVAETLERIGMVKKPDTLIQTAHILHKRGKYYIMHFKEMFLLDGKGQNAKNPFNEQDLARRNGIVDLLTKWNLVIPKTQEEGGNTSGLFIVPFRDRDAYDFQTKYSIGNKKG